jgi:N-acetylglutamate synthase-like GNAT family acetyltransferase
MQIRKITTNDAEALLVYLEELVLKDRERVEDINYFNSFTLSDEVKWIENKIISEEAREIFVRVVEQDNQIIAEGEVEKLKRSVERHVAEIRFGVLPGNEDAGEQVVEELMSIAKSNGIKILLYFHLSTQKAGIEIIKKLGFKLMGEIKSYYQFSDRLVDRVYYVKYL